MAPPNRRPRVSAAALDAAAEACAFCRPTAISAADPAAPELAAYLALHDVHADIVMFPSIDNSVGAGLLEAARQFGCDLLSMGAYSHSRLRQFILGGVTRTCWKTLRCR